jgi:hypothetical protein
MSEQDDIDELVGANDGLPIPIPVRGNQRFFVPQGAQGGFGQSPVVSEPIGSTPLDSHESDKSIPPVVLWAMKYMRRGLFSTTSGSDVIRWKSGDEDEHQATFVVDDGYDHCMVARFVGCSPDGCIYCLVTRVKRLDFEEVRQGVTDASALISLGRSFSLCGVIEGSTSNVVRVAGYRRYRDVPSEYLPPSPFIQFPDSL